MKDKTQRGRFFEAGLEIEKTLWEIDLLLRHVIFRIREMDSRTRSDSEKRTTDSDDSVSQEKK